MPGQSTIEAFDPATRSFNVIASTRAPVQGFEPAAPGEEPKPRLESLESWDLARFIKNPVVLVNHDTDVGSIIGGASNIRETERGLEMTVQLVTAEANPDADRVAGLLAERVLRGVSVGFEYGERIDEQRDGQTVAVFRDNVLNEISLVSLPADPNALVTDADTREPTWQDFAFAVYKLREKALETGAPADVREWHAAAADYRSRFSDAPRMPGQGAPRVAFDAAKQTRTTCSCPTYGGSCSCIFDPAQKVKTDMTDKSADYERGRRDAEAALTPPDFKAALERQRELQAAQQRRSQAPLFMTRDSWDVSELADRPNTSVVTPTGATGKPRPADTGAKVGPDAAEAPKRAPHQRSFRELAVPGALSKPRGRGPFDYREAEHPDFDPETAA